MSRNGKQPILDLFITHWTEDWEIGRKGFEMLGLHTDPTLEEEYETFWLPSEREVKSGTAAEDDEGVYWEDYWNSLGADASTTAANNARSVHRMDDPGQTCSVWLRTKNTNYTYQQGAISVAGVIVKTVHPDDKRRVTPICAVG